MCKLHVAVRMSTGGVALAVGQPRAAPLIGPHFVTPQLTSTGSKHPSKQRAVDRTPEPGDV